MRADQIRKGDELWGRTVTHSESHEVDRRQWLLQFDGDTLCYWLPCDAELDVVRPPKLIAVELPENTVIYYSKATDAHPVVAAACHKALADREGNQT